MKKLTVEECERISIFTIYHHVIWSIDKLFPDIPLNEFNAILDQRIEHISKQSIILNNPLKFLLIRTIANFGGIRYWFICPYCKRRVGTLYKPKNEIRFKCRHCHNLTYKSTQTHDNRIKSAEKLVLNRAGYASHLIRRKPKLLWKIYDKRNRTFPFPNQIREWKEKSAYNKYIKPLIEQ